jgi:hypothetical protein
VEPLSIVGGVNVSLVTSKYFACPGDGIPHPDARWLWSRPEFKIFRAVVVSNAVSVMNRLRWQQMSAEQFLDHEDVLKDVLPLPARGWPGTLTMTGHDPGPLA